jgi:hypothetical protein
MTTKTDMSFKFTKRAIDALTQYEATGSYPEDMTEKEFNLILSQWIARYGHDTADRNA